MSAIGSSLEIEVELPVLTETGVEMVRADVETKLGMTHRLGWFPQPEANVIEMPGLLEPLETVGGNARLGERDGKKRGEHPQHNERALPVLPLPHRPVKQRYEGDRRGDPSAS